MTAPRERDTETLYVTDAELIRRSGVPERIMRMRLRALDDDRKSGFPQKQKLWGNRRYWPAVKAYFDRYSGSTMASQSAAQGGRHDDRKSA